MKFKVDGARRRSLETFHFEPRLYGYTRSMKIHSNAHSRNAYRHDDNTTIYHTISTTYSL